MMISVYYSKEDKWVLDKIDELCAKERRSRSAIIMSILGHYFEREKRIGEILQDMGCVTLQQLQDTLRTQQKDGKKKRLGQLLREKGVISERDVQRALRLQSDSVDGG